MNLRDHLVFFKIPKPSGIFQKTIAICYHFLMSDSTFCMIDKEKTVCVVTVYNLASGKGVIIGDSVAIPEPYVTYISFTFNSKVG